MNHESTWRSDTREIIREWVKSDEGRTALHEAFNAANGSWGYLEKAMVSSLEQSLAVDDGDTK